MYVRLTGGRDRGEAKEFSVDDAKALIRNGHAVPVNFDEPDPLGKRVFEERDAQTQIAQQLAVPASQQTEPAVVTSAIATMSKFEKRHLGGNSGKKAR